MLVRHFMNRDVLVIEEKERCVDAYRKVRQRNVRHAPVVRNGTVVGMISNRDLFRALPWSFFDEDDLDSEASLSRTVGDVICRPVVEISSTDHLEDAARVMLEQKIGGLPVIDKHQLVGIITETDILRVFVRTTTGMAGTRITVERPAPSAGTEAPDAVRACMERGQRLSGLTTYLSPGGTTMVVLHVADGHVPELDRLRELGFVVLEVARLPSGERLDPHADEGGPKP